MDISDDDESDTVSVQCATVDNQHAPPVMKRRYKRQSVCIHQNTCYYSMAIPQGLQPGIYNIQPTIHSLHIIAYNLEYTKYSLQYTAYILLPTT